jgi:hypothetical protein
LLRLGVNRGLLFPPLKILHISLQLPLLAPESLPPPEMNANGGGNGQNGQERPHAQKEEGRMQNAEINFE